MRSSLRLFRLLGIDVKLHFTWWFVFILLVWSLYGYFAQLFPNHSTFTYLGLGVIAALLLFFSILLHELAHSMVAKYKSVSVKSITLFFFGGVAGISDEDLPPSTEIPMALAGPMFSFILAGIFYIVISITTNQIIYAVGMYLMQLNLLLAIFNLIPGFPLDGGRVLRAIVYKYNHNLMKATKVAVFGGKIFSGVLIVLGIVNLILLNTSGTWLILFGGFLFFIAGASYQHVLVKTTLNQVKVKELLHSLVTLRPGMTFAAFAKRYADSDQELFLVKDKNFQGILDISQLDKMSPQVQERIILKQVAQPLDEIKSVSKDTEAYLALDSMLEQSIDVLPVYQRKKLLGFISRDSILHRLDWGLKYGLAEKN